MSVARLHHEPGLRAFQLEKLALGGADNDRTAYPPSHLSSHNSRSSSLHTRHNADLRPMIRCAWVLPPPH